MKRILTLYTILVFSCTTPSVDSLVCLSPPTGPLPRSLETKTIGYDALVDQLNASIAGNFVIKDQNAWFDLMAQLGTDARQMEKQINFDCSIALAVVDRVRDFDGYSIEIVQVTEFSDSVVVLVKHLSQGGATLLDNQPYHIVLIPQTPKKLVFTNGCAPPYAGSFPRQITPLASFQHSNGGFDLPKQNLVITNQLSLDYWTRQLTMSSQIDAMTVDFDCETIIVVIDEMYAYCCSTIDITSIVETDFNIEVTIDRLNSPGGLAAFNQPIHVVKIPKIDLKEVIFLD